MRIFLIEPYYGGSHQAWADGYARFSAHEIFPLTLPARFWKWRMEGASLTLAERAASLVDRVGRPDVILASDMLDVPSFLGLARKLIGEPAVALYMHENQISYPRPPDSPVDVSYGFTNWLSAVACDLVVFNSQFHLDEFFSQLPLLLGSLPDFRHTPGVPSVRSKAEVLPVGIDLGRLKRARRNTGPPVLLWSQRWEYDKDPAAFFNAVYRLDEEGHEFGLILAGENFRQMPWEFEEARQRLAGRLLHYGRASAARYVDLLARADIVVSTARHEFFGVAIVEAVAAGALPVLPSRLSYPGLVPAAFHDRCLYGDDDGLLECLRWAFQERRQVREIAAELAPAMRAYDWSVVAPAYDARLVELATMRC